MRKKGLLILSTLPCLLLTSCGGVDFPFTDKEGLPTFCRNGNLYGVTDPETSYLDTTIEIDTEGIKSKLDRGEPVYLFLYQDTCSHCQQIHTRYTQFLIDSMMECYAFSMSNLSRGVRWIKENYPEMASVIQARTPEAYFLLPDGTAFDTTLLEKIEYTSTYENHIKTSVNLCSIYSFSKYTPLENFLSKINALLYFYDSKESEQRFYDEVINQYDARKVNKALAKIDYASLNEKEKAAVTAKFGENAANHVYYSEKGKEISEGQSLEEANKEDGLLYRYYSKVKMN